MKSLLLFFFLPLSFISMANSGVKDSLIHELSVVSDEEQAIITLLDIVRLSEDTHELDDWVAKAQPLLNKSDNDSIKLRFKMFEGLYRLYNQQDEQGMQLMMSALNDAQEKKDSLALASINYGIGSYYFYQEELELGLKYMRESLSSHPSYGNQLYKASILMSLGVLLSSKGESEESIEYQMQALNIKREYNSWGSIPVSLTNLAETYMDIGRNDEAMNIVDRSIFLADSVGQLESWAYAQFVKGEFYQMQGDYGRSVGHMESAIQWWEKENHFVDLPRGYETILISYKALNDYNNTVQTLESLLEIKDTLYNLGEANAAKSIEAKYNSEKKELELAREKEEREWAEKETALTKKTERQNFFIFFIVSIFLVISIIYFYIRFKNQRRDKNLIFEQKQQIEVRSLEIQDSIKYAKRLQSAIMPTVNSVQDCFRDSFVYYQPKDIVAGDFYWMDKIGETTVIAVADCTGHGVPGAMVSVVCTNGLNSAVKQHGLKEPGAILDTAREIVVREFAKSGENVKDGMDIALCSIEKNVLKFSGANNPLWLVRETQHLSEEEKKRKGTVIGEEFSLIEFKGNKQPVGLSDQKDPFLQIETLIYPKDKIYIFTDGFADQFGGLSHGVNKPTGKKFKYGPLKRLLLKNAQQPFDTQRNLLMEEFSLWKGDFEQVDDVCMIGFSI